MEILFSTSNLLCMERCTELTQVYYNKWLVVKINLPYEGRWRDEGSPYLSMYIYSYICQIPLFRAAFRRSLPSLSINPSICCFTRSGTKSTTNLRIFLWKICMVLEKNTKVFLERVSFCILRKGRSLIFFKQPVTLLFRHLREVCLDVWLSSCSVLGWWV